MQAMGPFLQQGTVCCEKECHELALNQGHFKCQPCKLRLIQKVQAQPSLEDFTTEARWEQQR